MAEKVKKEEEVTKEGESPTFVAKVKEFVHDIGEKLEEAIGFGKPTVDLVAIHVPKINTKKAELVVELLIKNPNPIPIPLVDVNYEVQSGARSLVAGKIPDAGTIKSHGSQTVKIPVTLVFKDLIDTFDEFEPGSVFPYKIKVDLIADVPVFGKLTLPLDADGEFPIPEKPDVDIEKVVWDDLSWDETKATVLLKVENLNKFDIGITKLDYELTLAGVLVAKTSLGEATSIKGKGVTSMKLPFSFRPKDFGDALWDVIRGKGTGYDLYGTLQANTPFGPVSLPFGKEGGETKLRKNDEDDD
eukprot:TRINITY_DN18837_c0_g1_i1.p1 TRINITY_DN18837_c0_g1~~TRINITY_DN18837_c0_g1_i1.p1  ORF type:complete len:301 (+),score=64.54 TRINITY_DN18837_c0_g1_i1:312-1214(+)